MKHLTDKELFGPEDPLFPKPKVGVVKGKGFQNLGLSREPYASTSSLYKAVKTAFTNVQMPSYTPHNFRKTHGALMSIYCDTADKMKAWSLNFGHDDLITTISSYVPVSLEKQGTLMREMQKGSKKA